MSFNIFDYVHKQGSDSSKAQQVQKATGSWVAADGFLATRIPTGERTMGQNLSEANARAKGYFSDDYDR